jgi:hypothetical protein
MRNGVSIDQLRSNERTATKRINNAVAIRRSLLQETRNKGISIAVAIRSLDRYYLLNCVSPDWLQTTETGEEP